MGKKMKWALLTMLGFATACSTVKNTAKGTGSPEEGDSVKVETPERTIRLMYGVQPPVPLEEVERQRAELQAQEAAKESAEKPASETEK